MAIYPIADDKFSMQTLHEADRLGNHDPAQLTDLHLQHVAVYDQGLADSWARKRDVALQEKAARSHQQPPAPQPHQAPKFATAEAKHAAIYAALDKAQRAAALTPDERALLLLKVTQVEFKPVEQCVLDILKFIKKLNKKNIERNERLDALEQRLAALDGIKSARIWNAETTYNPDDIVMHDGRAWRAVVRVKGVTPGDGSLWKLHVDQ